MPIDVAVVWPVRHESAGIYEGPISGHHDEMLFVRKRCELSEIDDEQRIQENKELAQSGFGDRVKRPFKLVSCSCLEET